MVGGIKSRKCTFVLYERFLGGGVRPPHTMPHITVAFTVGVVRPPQIAKSFAYFSRRKSEQI